ncbi:HlyD family efflux transporter periplasmic adaptor subunit [Segetibacter sp. 3557_3]|uniref:efflux RND transporter periplasmic adaptor subunit n=1 Tax=Segetibacter sp. 3557_3 TaxID=2547429 RepID=UPI001059153E|nr:HlyD family efflux transporter periplasmic adaptor subunit [Segetibacter sp. 3557_3]TDH24201.1 HlyD family efflux transporter periplasmic adaptor subunit [Segetibacter sp. 3557_3]
MDRQIQKKKWSRKRILTIVGVVATVALITLSFLMTSGKSRLNVDTERITVSEISKGSFQEFIPVNGVVLPITTIYLDAVEGGRVEEKFVEDGAMMVKGQPILRLANTDLELSLSNQETAVFNVLTQMQDTRNNADQNTIRQLNQMADVENALVEAERIYKLNKHLYEEKAIGSQEFKASENNYTYQQRRKKLTQETLDKDATGSKMQIRQARESYSRMQNALALMRRKVGDLIVRAPVDGQLTSLDAEIGQSKNKGERLGQLDVTSGFKIRADIDEHYISRIFTGLMGEFTLGAKSYKLKITKVYTQVTAGRFQVDMAFTDAVPSGIRRGQTLQIRLALGDETQAVLLAKGGFFQQTGGNWIFKVSDNGQIAYKTDIQLGRQNPDYYEVLSGLKPGDKVVTSSYENYGNMQELVLKKP